MSNQLPNNQTHRNEQLLQRTKVFARSVRQLLQRLPRSLANVEDSKQLIRSSGSVAANAIEMNEALSKKDFLLRAKIVRKEAKESILWLELITVPGALRNEHDRLLDEAKQLKLIFSSIVTKVGS